MADEAPIKTTSSKIVYQNPWITIREDKTLTPTGNEGLYGYLESRDSVMVAAVDTKQRVCLVKAYRYPSKSWGWELPGGGGDNQDGITAARRELEEEAGIRADYWQKLSETLVCNGFMTERLIVCAAAELHFDGHKEDGDEVFQDMHFFTPEEIDGLIESGEINDGQTITGLFFLQRWLQKGGRK